MRRAARALALLATVALSSALIAAVAWGAKGDTRLVSRASADAGNAPANGGSESASVSADGRYVAFASFADNLGDGDADTESDVFVRDTQTGATRLVSRASAPANTPANGNSFSPSISADGRYVAFLSFASNLGDGDTDTHADVFVRDTLTGATRLVGPSFSSSRPAISADGRHVAFVSLDDDLVEDDSNNTFDVFVRDTLTGTTSIVSRPSAPTSTQANFPSFSPAISADGRHVAFLSLASNLGDGDTDTQGDVFVRDTVTGATRLVSRASAPGNEPADGGPFVDTSPSSPSISADGRFIAFDSDAPNLAGESDRDFDVFVRDMQTAETRLVSRHGAPDDTPAIGGAMRPSISADGRYVAFESRAANLGDGDNDADGDVFVRDMQTGATSYVSRASAPANTAANGASFSPSISADGRYVAFASRADNLGDGDTDTDGDVFVRDFLGAPVADNPPAATDPPPGVTDPPQALPDTLDPALTGVSLTNARFRVGSQPTAVLAQRRRRAPRGTTFRYTLSEQATVEIAIDRAGRGVRLQRRGSRGLRCVSVTRANRRRLARELLQTAAIRRLRGAARRRALRRATARRACTSFKRVGVLTRRDQGPGAVRTAFTGRIGRRSLRPARYRARLRATDAAGNRAAERRLTFRVVRR